MSKNYGGCVGVCRVGACGTLEEPYWQLSIFCLNPELKVLLAPQSSDLMYLARARQVFKLTVAGAKDTGEPVQATVFVVQGSGIWAPNRDP